MEVGNKVKLISIHPNHNRYLKTKLGKEGVVSAIARAEILVDFLEDPFSSRLWVKPKYLKRV